jgi:translation initiation factor IF-3
MELRRVMAQYDRTTHSLVNVTPDAEEPTCKLYSKKHLFEVEIAKKASAKHSVSVTKELQLTWAISPHDLSHRLRTAVTALRKGNRVEVTIGSKKGSKSKLWLQ